MTELTWIATMVQRVVLWLEPAGGQAAARRNAWVALVADNRRKGQRLEAERSVEATIARYREHATAV
jgi:hypothetical protein